MRGADFLRAKYCQRANPIKKKWDRDDSLVNSGSNFFWWDDWLGVGPLANFRSGAYQPNNSKVAAFFINGAWDVEKITQKPLLKWFLLFWILTSNIIPLFLINQFGNPIQMIISPAPRLGT
ncbi:hypothetical protein H5410_051412, partial [Solanum commersonii]